MHTASGGSLPSRSVGVPFWGPWIFGASLNQQIDGNMRSWSIEPRLGKQFDVSSTTVWSHRKQFGHLEGPLARLGSWNLGPDLVQIPGQTWFQP